MSTQWVIAYEGVPPAGVFSNTRGQGSPIVIDTLTDQAYYFDGTAVQLLSPSSATPPAGATTEVQYNNAGSFGASSNFTYDSGTNTLSFGNFTGSGLGFTLKGRAATVLDNYTIFNNSLFITGGAALMANTSGQRIYFRSGDGNGTGNGGIFQFVAGNGGSSGSGGSFSAAAGNGSGTGEGGQCVFVGGGASGSGPGGRIRFEAGSSNAGNGGSIQLTPGGSSAGTSGDFIVLLNGSPIGRAEVYFSLGYGEIEGGLFRIESQNFGQNIFACDDDGATGTRFAFFGATPALQQTLPVAAVDPATTQALANAIRDVLLLHGICL